MKSLRLTGREVLTWYVAAAVLSYTLYRSFLLKVLADGSTLNTCLQFLGLTVMILCPLAAGLRSSWRKQLVVPAPVGVIVMGIIINLFYLKL